MPDEKKYLKQWRDGNNLYYFYDEDAHTELNALGSELTTKIAAEDVYDKTTIDNKFQTVNDFITNNSTSIETINSTLGEIYSNTEIDSKFNELPTSYYTKVDAEQTFLKKTDSYTRDEIANLLEELKTELEDKLNKINLPTLSGKYTLIVSGEGDSLAYNWEKVQETSTGGENV